MEDNKRKYRHLARVIIETTSPLNIGSGNKNVKTDSAILRDVNGFPFIPGTTLAGLIRHALQDDKQVSIMGNQEDGSLLIVTEAKMLDSKGHVLDGIISLDEIDDVTKSFRQLPIRQHVRISHRGAAEKSGKFDEEIALKGTRFCFELELISNKSDCTDLHDVLNIIRSTSFRIGSGSRSGFGNIKVVSIRHKTINLNDEADKNWYLEKSSTLTSDWEGNNYDCSPRRDENWTEYQLQLHPTDFVLFGSGLGNENADMTYVRESFIEWNDNSASIKDRERVLLVPASSVKGAISHRVAFHYNKLRGFYADQLPLDEFAKYVGDKNNAVKTLFGCEGKNEGDKQRGNVLMSDVIQEKAELSKPKVLNHVAIDRFTGGAIDGALFDEETLYAKEENITFSLLVNNDAFKEEYVKESFEQALKDICSGLLPLGGGVNRGNGCFTGKLFNNGELIYE